MSRKPAQKAAERMHQEQLYEIVVQEIAEDKIRPGLWGQALSEADGDKNKAEARYIRARVQSLLDEQELVHSVDAERTRASRNKGAITSLKVVSYYLLAIPVFFLNLFFLTYVFEEFSEHGFDIEFGAYLGYFFILAPGFAIAVRLANRIKGLEDLS